MERRLLTHLERMTTSNIKIYLLPFFMNAPFTTEVALYLDLVKQNSFGEASLLFLIQVSSKVLCEKKREPNISLTPSNLNHMEKIKPKVPGSIKQLHTITKKEDMLKCKIVF